MSVHTYAKSSVEDELLASVGCRSFRFLKFCDATLSEGSRFVRPSTAATWGLIRSCITATIAYEFHSISFVWRRSFSYINRRTAVTLYHCTLPVAITVLRYYGTILQSTSTVRPIPPSLGALLVIEQLSLEVDQKLTNGRKSVASGGGRRGA